MTKYPCNCNIGMSSLLNHGFSLFNSLSNMGDSKQLMKILFLCMISVWIRATVNRRVSTKFPTCVDEIFYVWQEMNKKGSLLGASNCEKRLLASSCLSVRLYLWTEFHVIWYLNIFRKSVMKIEVSCKYNKKNGSLT
jgi:hypothetical protein